MVRFKPSPSLLNTLLGIPSRKSLFDIAPEISQVIKTYKKHKPRSIINKDELLSMKAFVETFYYNTERQEEYPHNIKSSRYRDLEGFKMLLSTTSPTIDPATDIEFIHELLDDLIGSEKVNYLLKNKDSGIQKLLNPSSKASVKNKHLKSIIIKDANEIDDKTIFKTCDKELEKLWNNFQSIDDSKRKFEKLNLLFDKYHRELQNQNFLLLDWEDIKENIRNDITDIKAQNLENMNLKLSPNLKTISNLVYKKIFKSKEYNIENHLTKIYEFVAKIHNFDNHYKKKPDEIEIETQVNHIITNKSKGSITKNIKVLDIILYSVKTFSSLIVENKRGRLSKEETRIYNKYKSTRELMGFMNQLTGYMIRQKTLYGMITNLRESIFFRIDCENSEVIKRTIENQELEFMGISISYKIIKNTDRDLTLKMFIFYAVTKFKEGNKDCILTDEFIKKMQI
ncbi:hypothetical protein BN7_4531 [Wickerhamomyces ciferrii]|uniref:Uncharacterized protein n=1 Tax=Wickerhamomyces ciferrii (strain ATCC 14091 / BCRC 22168 / CBS 111 / JCM 3599 / NBRC 0793 / NRRL Y-1031 F-60-10) TaxID=1206466 RepID=K0KUX1_WICCF|nr:uncharacterized protein BN7_4531 [Wickerhamomyces ciferrii]CCH44958.1 hypothetical protein BN7_4531 [Wickerhamomyces ciferrii]